MTSVPTPSDRREHKRYAIRNPLRYRAANSPIDTGWKHGRAIDMSARGILIQIPEKIAAGSRLELAMDWTGLYHDRDRMRLFLTASVMRTDRRGTALRILSHRFRDVRPLAVRPRRAEKKLAVAS